MTNSLALITARSGSKRISNKNIKPFLGQPIIAYPIRAALESELFSEVMVSTDSEEYANVAINSGASVPFFRSQGNSDDHASTRDVILEVISKYADLGKYFDFVCCIYPTAVFATVTFLTDAFHLLQESSFDAIIPISQYPHPIQRALRIDGQCVSFANPNCALQRTQDLEEFYHDCGMFYWLRVDKFMKSKSIVTSNSSYLIVPRTQTQDIDTPEDWDLAEHKYRKLCEAESP